MNEEARRPPFTFGEYHHEARKTAKYPGSGMGDPTYPVIGLCGECGEIAEKYKKVLRDRNGHPTSEDKKAILFEIGDALWYLDALATEIGYDLEEAARLNVAKLKDRSERGVIGGSGDNR